MTEEWGTRTKLRDIVSTLIDQRQNLIKHSHILKCIEQKVTYTFKIDGIVTKMLGKSLVLLDFVEQENTFPKPQTTKQINVFS